MKIMKKYMIHLVLALNLSVISGCRQDDAVYQLAQETVQTESEAEDGENDAKAEETIVVHICGAVANPGVYTLSKGSRVWQLIEAAGGLTEEAQESSLNQAATLQDGQQIIVCTEEEAAQLAAKADAGGQNGQYAKVNLNTADETTLQTLSGIGEARARAIIAYREAHGGFRSTEELMEIEGIKEKLYEKIKEQIEI